MQWPTVLDSSGHLAATPSRRGLMRGVAPAEAERPASAKLDHGAIVDTRLETRGPRLRSKKREGPRGRRAGQRRQSGPNSTSKRAFDLVIAGIALVVLFVPIVVIAIAVMAETPGPVLFRQWRGGRDGQRFQILKFRTMTCMEDGADVSQVRPGDARVTKVGRILRRTSLDELPQLWNVLRGDMSLVGPRPHALVHDAMYSRLITRYAYRHSVRPGMTGWAQVNGCRGETRDLIAMERRVARDLAYIRHWSFWLDLVIVAMTVREVLRSQNAC